MRGALLPLAADDLDEDVVVAAVVPGGRSVGVGGVGVGQVAAAVVGDAPRPADLPVDGVLAAGLARRSKVLAKLGAPLWKKDFIGDLATYCSTSSRMAAHLTMWYTMKALRTMRVR